MIRAAHGSFCPIRERTVVVTSGQILAFRAAQIQRPGDKDHAASAHSIVGGETIKETALINENKHP